MKPVIVCFLLVLWLLMFGGAGAQSVCQYVWYDCFWWNPDLADMVAIIGMYRGGFEPWSVCDCGPRGEQFPVCVDVDGNCIALELSDVVYLISYFRRCAPEPIMFPDCS